MSNPWENPNQEPGENNEPHRMPQGMPTGPVTPPMGRRKGTWYAWTPLLIKYLISIAVSMIAVMGYMFVYISQHYEETVGAMQSQQDMLELSVSISERMLQYTTQLEGITALIVIPVILYMFHRDRKNEKMAGVIPNRKAPLWKYGAVIGIAAALCVGLNNLILISNISSYSAAYQRNAGPDLYGSYASRVAAPLPAGCLLGWCSDTGIKRLAVHKRARICCLCRKFYAAPRLPRTHEKLRIGHGTTVFH